MPPSRESAGAEHLSTKPAPGVTVRGFPGRSEGAGSPLKWAKSASWISWWSERPCSAQEDAAVRMRSLQVRPASPRVPCVRRRWVTTKRVARSAALWVGSRSGVATKRKYSLACSLNRLARFRASVRDARSTSSHYMPCVALCAKKTSGPCRAQSGGGGAGEIARPGCSYDGP